MTVLSGSSAGKMIRNEVMMAASPMGSAPCRSGRPAPSARQLTSSTAAEGLTQASSPPGTGSSLLLTGGGQPGGDRDCRRPGDGATPLRSLRFTQRQPESIMSADVPVRGQVPL